MIRTTLSLILARTSFEILMYAMIASSGLMSWWMLEGGYVSAAEVDYIGKSVFINLSADQPSQPGKVAPHLGQVGLIQDGVVRGERVSALMYCVDLYSSVILSLFPLANQLPPLDSNIIVELDDSPRTTGLPRASIQAWSSSNSVLTATSKYNMIRIVQSRQSKQTEQMSVASKSGRKCLPTTQKTSFSQ